jgi:DNA repair protein RadC
LVKESTVKSHPRELPDRQLEDILLTGVRGLELADAAGVAEPAPRYVASPERRRACIKQLLACAHELAKREGLLTLRQAIGSPEAAKDYVRLHFKGYEVEAFVVLYLDAVHRVIGVEELFRGTLTQTSVYPREVVRMALLNNAGALMLAHNHPSGMAEPSRADEYLTATLKSALALVDVRLLDHFVVGGDTVVSFSEKGLL